MENQIKKRKKKKVAGEDKIKNEAWLCCMEKVKHRLLGIIQRVWEEEDFPKKLEEKRDSVYILCKKYPKLLNKTQKN